MKIEEYVLINEILNIGKEFECLNEDSEIEKSIRVNEKLKGVLEKIKSIFGVGGGLLVYTGIQELITKGITPSKAVPIGLLVFLISNLNVKKNKKENLNVLIKSVVESTAFFSILGFVIDLAYTGSGSVAQLSLGILAVFVQFFGKDILKKVNKEKEKIAKIEKLLPEANPELIKEKFRR